MNIDIKKQKYYFRNIIKYGCKELEDMDKVLLCCMKKGYRDMTTARETFSGLGAKYEEKGKDFRKNFYNQIVAIVASLIKHSSIDNFDKNHNECCKKIGKLFKKEFPDFYNLNREFYYGSAQKLVNMALKYFLLAAEDFVLDKQLGLVRPDTSNQILYEKIFELEDKLHCPVDGFILQELDERDVFKTKTPWSKMGEAEYLKIQEKIQELVGNQSKLNFDFEVWNKMTK